MGVVVVDERAGALALELLAAEHAGKRRERRGGAIDVPAGEPDRRQGCAGFRALWAPGTLNSSGEGPGDE